MKKSVLLFVALLCLPAILFAQQRDPLKWPFAKTSIWNMPIHTNAVYVPANIQNANNFEADEDVIIMTPNEPLLPVNLSTAGWSGRDRCIADGGALFSAPIATSYIFDNTVWYGRTPNAGAAILLSSGKIKQTQPFAKCAYGFATSQYVWSENLCELKGECIQGAHGGSGMSTIGGTVRVGELTAGVIKHALKINLWGKENFSRANGGYRWPAIRADGGYNDSTAFNYYNGTNPELRIGALLAIYKDAVLNSVNDNSLGIETEAGLIFARALRDYGAYAVDNTAWDSYAFVIENGPDGIVRNEFRNKFGYGMNVSGSLNNTPWARDLKRIFTNLYVISSNTSAYIGGGPTTDITNRRAPIAPDFIGTAPQKIIKIMPLGDSKTEGGGGSGQSSWRGFLRTKLVKNGYSIDYVGDRSNIAAGDTIPADNNHAGHGGYTIGPDINTFCSTCETTGLYEHIQDWLPPANPDVVLLSIGVNDMYGAASHAPNYARTAPARYRALVNKILELKPSVKIILGTVEPVKYDVNWGGNPNDNNLGALNAKIKAIADSSLTDNIYFVDIRARLVANFSPADFWDEVHLSAQGARKAADGWLEAVVPILNDIPNNAAPAVSITSPLTNSIFSAPASITLQAEASDTDGTISKVMFYNGSVKVGEDTSPPFSYTWNNVDEGTYLITAIAVDNFLATGTSPGITVSVSSVDGYVKFAGTGIGSSGSYNNNGLVFSKALDGDLTTYFDGASANGQWVGLDLGIAKTVKKARYVPRSTWSSRIVGGKIQGANSPDFSDAVDLFPITLTPLEDVYSIARFPNTNLYQFYRFLSPNGSYGNIAEVEFWGDPNDPVNQAPLCNLITPTNTSIFTSGSEILLNATASDVDGTISKIDFYQGTTLLGTATIAPYRFVWSNVPAGNYSISAKATDNAGITKSSGSAKIKVNSIDAGSVLYAETFDSNTSAGWVVNNGTWSATSLKYRGTNAGGEYTSFYNGENFNNYTLTIDALATYGNDHGVIFNYQNASNYYLLVLNADSKITSLKRRMSGTLSTLATGTFTGRGIATTHNVYIKNTGATTTIKINDTLIFDNVSTPTFTSGKIGVYSFYTPTTFDNVTVSSNTALPLIAITSPTFNSIVDAPQTIPITLAITDTDNIVNKVEYYNAEQLIGTVTSAPYSFSIVNPTSGHYYLSAKATSSTGYQINSSVISFTVNPQGSLPPTVSFITPTEGQLYTSPATITVGANAQDTNGSIEKIDFYQGNTMIGTAYESPFQINWTEVNPGNYSLMASATDNEGAVTNTSLRHLQVNHPAPLVRMISPIAGTVITGLDVTLSAEATTADGSIAKVDFFRNDILIGTDVSSPYSLSWKLPAGVYAITAKATDNLGIATTSEPINLTVNGYVAAAVNLLPSNTSFETLAGINYANGAYTGIPGWNLFNSAYNNIGVTTGSAADGNKKLQIINAGYGETAVGHLADVSAGNQYALTISLKKTASRNAAVSSPAHLLIKWFDANGVYIDAVTSGNISGGAITGWETYTITGTAPANATKASAKINVNIGTAPNTGLADFQADYFVFYKIADAQAPAVAITSPLTNTTLNSPSSISINAIATDNDGTISKVEFYKDSVLLGSDVSYPYSYSWTDAAAGQYSITAKATDNHNVSTISAPIQITVSTVPLLSVSASATASVKIDSSYLSLAATTAITGGTIQKVELYNGTILIATVTNAPYTFKWLNAAAGNYSITAKATDNTGQAILSDPVSVSVVAGKLNLTSVCSANPAVTRKWRVTNTYTTPISFRWNVYGTTQSGLGSVPGNGLGYFETTTIAGANTTIITYGNNVQVNKASSGEVCSTSNGRTASDDQITDKEIIDTQPSFEVYPNPAREEFTIEYRGFVDPQISVSNSMAQVVYLEAIVDNKLQINPKLSDGIYIITIKDKMNIRHKKIIIKR